MTKPQEKKKIIKKITKDVVELDDGALGYDIPREHLSNPRMALFWIEHLLEKNWISKESLRQFLALIKEENKK